MEHAPLATDSPKDSGSFAVLLRLVPYLWPPGEWGLRSRVIIAMLAIFAGKGATVVMPIFYKQAVDALSGETAQALAVPVGLILAYGLARLLSLGFNQLRDAVFERVAQRALRRAGVAVFTHLHALSLRFHLGRQTGRLSRAIERGTKAIESVLGILLFNILPTFLELALVVGVLWGLLDFSFALVTLVTVGSYIAFTVYTTEWRLKFRRQMNEADSTANTKAIDSLLNYETVKYFNAEAHETGRYDRAMGRYEDAAVTSQMSLSLLNAGQIAIIAGGLTLLMYMAARGIVSGEMTVGDFVLVNTYLIQLAQPLNIFGWVYRSVKQSLVDMEQMFDLLREPQEVRDRPNAPALRLEQGAVRFEDVGFAYDKRRPILAHVGFHVPPGGKLAIVGPSGAGKSTIARLLFRFYDVSSGRILIDGQDIRHVDQLSLRQCIGIVPQDTVLFNDTIAYNIGYARPDLPPGPERDAAIARAARLAHLDAFIAKLPDGYETLVGERGLKLSGGEKQRVAIARVFLKEPRILLLDEATSALDTATEREIQANLQAVALGRTTLVIAHRLSTVTDADEILVLEDGQIVERGDHGTLLALGGQYAAMWARQSAAGSATATGADGQEPPESR